MFRRTLQLIINDPRIFPQTKKYSLTRIKHDANSSLLDVYEFFADFSDRDPYNIQSLNIGRFTRKLRTFVDHLHQKSPKKYTLNLIFSIKFMISDLKNF